MLHWRAIRIAATQHLPLFNRIESGDLDMLLSLIESERRDKEEQAEQEAAGGEVQDELTPKPDETSRDGEAAKEDSKEPTEEPSGEAETKVEVAVEQAEDVKMEDGPPQASDPVVEEDPAASETPVDPVPEMSGTVDPAVAAATDSTAGAQVADENPTESSLEEESATAVLPPTPKRARAEEVPVPEVVSTRKKRTRHI